MPGSFQKKKQNFRSTSRKHLQKQKNEHFLIQLLNAWLYFNNKNFSVPTSVKKILDKTHIFKYTVQTENLSSIACRPGIFETHLLLFIRNLCKCLLPCLISCTIFREKLHFTTTNHKRKYKFIIGLIHNDCKHLLKTSPKKFPF